MYLCFIYTHATYLISLYIHVFTKIHFYLNHWNFNIMWCTVFCNQYVLSAIHYVLCVVCILHIIYYLLQKYIISSPKYGFENKLYIIWYRIHIYIYKYMRYVFSSQNMFLYNININMYIHIYMFYIYLTCAFAFHISCIYAYN